jgi:dolichol-phosphate mannosyltransferase
MTDLSPRKLEFLSFVFPIYNEEKSLPGLRAALEQWLLSLHDARHEIILVNDGSRDGSLDYCSMWANASPGVKVISFSRNFGHQAAVSAGLRYAAGEAVVIMDADQQDPLETVTEMIARYEEGYDVAYGQRISRKGETFFKRASAWLFYRLMRQCVNKDFPVDTGDFRLVSRRCVDAINAMPESHRFLRGMFAWAGFNQVPVFYNRHERQHGETKYPLWKMLSFAWTAITSFSTKPIRMVFLCGFCFALIGFLICLYAVLQFCFGDVIRGWTSLIGLISLIGGAHLVSIGIIGEYVGRIYDEVKMRPIYLIERTINISSSTNTHSSDV